MKISPTISRTDMVIANMLVENTGRHFLDSGGAYGRSWERNQAKAGDDPVDYFMARPEAWMDDWGCVTIDVFHFLRQRLDYSAELDRRWRMWCRLDGSDRYDSDRRYFNSVGTFEEWVDAMVKRGWASHGEFGTGLTYNTDNAVSQDFHWVHFELTDHPTLPDGEYVGVNIHGGCDIRGGYTDFRVFSLGGHEGMYDLLNFNGYEVWYECDGSHNPDPNQPRLDGTFADQCPYSTGRASFYNSGGEFFDDGSYVSDRDLEQAEQYDDDGDVDPNPRIPKYRCHCGGVLSIAGCSAPYVS